MKYLFVAFGGFFEFQSRKSEQVMKYLYRKDSQSITLKLSNKQLCFLMLNPERLPE